MPTDLNSLLAELRTALKDLYGERLDRLVLYGSQARGDTHAESDVAVDPIAIFCCTLNV